MKIKAAVFDLDGTLINSLADLADSMNTALIANGLPTHSLEKYTAMIGNGVVTLAKRAAGSENKDVYEPVLAKMRQVYEKHATNKTTLYTGIAELITSLKNMDIKLAVLTNKDEIFAIQLVDYFFEKGSFEAVWGSGVRGVVKPDPAALIQLLEQLRVSPDQTLFIGDSGVDMQVAKAAGAFGVGAAWGFRSKQELCDNGAKTIIDSPAELLSLID